MSGSDVPGRDDRTRRVDPVEHRDPDATRRIDRGDPDATRRVDRGDLDATRQIDATGAAHGDDDGYVTVPNRPPDARDPGPGGPPVEEEPERSRGRDWAIGLGGVVAGVLLAVIVAFLVGGDDEPVDGEVAASQDQVEVLEAERDDLRAQIEELEARVADAEAAAGEGEADAAAEREALDARATALDERAASLDARESALDEREGALAERERALDEREAALQQREDEAPAGDGSGDGSGDGGGNGGGEDLLPDIDGEEVEGFVDRIFDRIRGLF